MGLESYSHWGMLQWGTKRETGGRTLCFQVLTHVTEVWSAGLGKEGIEFKGRRKQQPWKQYVLSGCGPEAQNLS